MRQSEGTALVTDLEQACVSIGELVQQIRKRVPEVVAEHRQRLLDRVAKVLETHQARLDDNDVIREVALIADRSDISEELVRLESHVEQFRNLLGDTAPGRSLDFSLRNLAVRRIPLGQNQLMSPLRMQSLISSHKWKESANRPPTSNSLSPRNTRFTEGPLSKASHSGVEHDDASN